MENETYTFKSIPTRIGIKTDIKKHKNSTRRLWNELQQNGWELLGVVRDWTAIFRKENWHITIHHFIEETPNAALLGENCTSIRPGDLLGDEPDAFEVLVTLFNLGFELRLPIQTFTDAFIWDTCGFGYNWHHDSPKHKLSIWGTTEKASVHVEFFYNMPLAPYGTVDAMKYPNLDMKFVQASLFGDEDESTSTSRRRKKQESGEIVEFDGIPEYMDPDKLAQAERAIEQVFKDFSKISIAFSGGKDSQVTLLLLFRYLQKHPESEHEIYIVSADTLVENPLIKSHLDKVKKAVDGFCQKIGRNIPFIFVEPEEGQDFFTCLLGKGYSPPSSAYRWCVDRLKIEPAQKELEKLFGTGKPTCQLLGTRSSESENRARSMERAFGGELYSQHPVQNLYTAAPIINWTAKDVVTFLVREPAPWENEYSNYRLINLYGSASSFGECPIGAAITSDSEAKCSGRSARFGCWVCTLVDEDVSLRNLTMDYPELEPYYEFRTILKAAQDIRYGGMAGYQRHPRSYSISGGIGDLTLDMRTMLLKHLKRLGLDLPDEIVTNIYKEVVKREHTEGIAVTDRFRKALFAHYTVHPVFTSAMYNPIWDPFGTGVDRCTAEDAAAIKRVLAKIEEEKKLEASISV